ncbi:MAG: hypothetical protein DRP09_09875 [Candidatus Thorarchaeota archaeon]|nr:MAG: hypothetical protein DRP09_09875 [Candidatus Thorarchaeota archaeon]
MKTVADGDHLFAEDMNSIINALRQNGVIEGFSVSASSGMDVTVASGEAYVNGKYVKVSSSQTVTISTADSSLGRIDLITLDEDGVAHAETGSALTNPIPPTPSMTRIVLASISVDAATTSISSGDITDERIFVKHQLYKMPWLSEVETGGDVEIFDDNGTTIESNWTRIIDPDYILPSSSEIVMQNGLIRIKTRKAEASNQGYINIWIAEDMDYDDDGTAEYIGMAYSKPNVYIDSSLWNLTSVTPTITFQKISPDECKIRLRYSDSNRVLDQFITMKKGERWITIEYSVEQLASGDTQLTDIYSGIRDMTGDTRFYYRDISSGGKFRDAVIESASVTGDGDNLNKNYQIIYGKTETSPFIWGLAYDKKPSHSTGGAYAYYNNNEWTLIYGRETGLTVSSGDVGVKTYIFGLPFPDIDHLFKEGEVSTSDEFGRTDVVGTWVSVSDANRSGGYYLTNDDANGGSSAQNDDVRYKIYIPKTGYYDIWVAGYEGTSMGITDVQIDSSSKGTIDWYASSGAWTYKAVENVSISKGRHNLDFIVSSKNASSSDYEFSIDALYIVPKYETSNFDGDFPYDIARQAISDNEFSYGYVSPLSYEGILDTDDVTNDWSFSAVPVAWLPVGSVSSSETIDFYRYARKRYVSSVITQEAESGKTDVTGTWSTESGYGDDSTNSISCTTDGGEVKWTINFPRTGWYLVRAHIRESDGATDDKYQYAIKNNSVSGAYVTMSNSHLHDEDSSDSSIHWSYADAIIYVEQGDQDIQMKGSNTTDKKVIDKLWFYPVDPIPFIGSPSSPTSITFTTNRISDVPHSRLDGINQMDSIQAKYGKFNYIKMNGDVNMNGNEIKELVVHVSATAPSNPVEGQLWFDSANSQFKGWNGSSWQVL